MNKQQLATKIWESANRMRSKIEANEYKDYILGFIFYKYLSEKEEHWLYAQQYRDEDIRNYVNENDVETLKNVQRDLGYFIAYKDLFSTWLGMGADFSIDNVQTALSSFSRLISPSHKKVFAGIFTTLETGLSKLGESTQSRTKAARDLIHLIDEIPMGGKQDYDVLGFIYEYLISNFAANAGKKAGEFYTPHEVSLLMSEIVADHLKGRKEIDIYDPTSGSGSLLINIGHTMAKYMEERGKIKYYAQELKANTYNLTRMNLVMRGISPDNIVTRNGDTLEEDWPYFDEDDPAGTYDPLYVDAVVSNPPYSQRWNPEGKDSDPRYARYGIAPKSKADYAFLLHDLYHLRPDGIMTIVLPHGVLFRGGEEGEIRKNLIEQNNIEAIIGLPANIFYGTGIPTIIMVLRQKRQETDVLIIDASKGYTKDGKNNKLRASDIRRIVDTIKGWKSVGGYAHLASRQEIRENDYNLNIPRYVDSSGAGESYDIYASMYGGIPQQELGALSMYWRAFPSLKETLFQPVKGEFSQEYAELRVADIKKTVRENEDVRKFQNDFAARFADFGAELDSVLIAQAESLSIAKTEDDMTASIFRRMKGEALVDAYEAYEIFAGKYTGIAGDLEIIQSEGRQAVKKVDPNMVARKKNGKEVTVQDGWKGRILPFDLVQRVCLPEELATLKAKQEELAGIPERLTDLLEEMSEEEKELISDVLNDTNDAFVAKNLKSTIKILQENVEENEKLIATLRQAEKLTTKEKELKRKIKQDEIQLHEKTKETIEQLSDEDAEKLLHEKWISPVLAEITALPEALLKTLVEKVQHLAEKYATTMRDLEQEIQATETNLAELLADLIGNDADMQGIRELRKLLGGK